MQVHQRQRGHLHREPSNPWNRRRNVNHPLNRRRKTFVNLRHSKLFVSFCWNIFWDLDAANLRGKSCNRDEYCFGFDSLRTNWFFHAVIGDYIVCYFKAFQENEWKKQTIIDEVHVRKKRKTKRLCYAYDFPVSYQAPSGLIEERITVCAESSAF